MNSRQLERSLVAAVKESVRTRNGVRVPEGGHLFWRFFQELSAARTMGPNGPNAIQFTEIEAWARLKRWPLEPHHIDLITAMDQAWVEAVYGEQAKHSQHAGRTVLPESPEALDAMFAKF
ncbi:MAG: hypothetical protein AAGH60_02080 [Pseudomonadota bacterium]